MVSRKAARAICELPELVVRRASKGILHTTKDHVICNIGFFNIDIIIEFGLYSQTLSSLHYTGVQTSKQYNTFNNTI